MKHNHLGVSTWPHIIYIYIEPVLEAIRKSPKYYFYYSQLVKKIVPPLLPSSWSSLLHRWCCYSLSSSLHRIAAVVVDSGAWILVISVNDAAAGVGGLGVIRV